MPLAYSFNVETPNQLVNIMTEQGVYLPMDIGLQQMANIRFVFLTHRLRQIPFDIIKINNCWFIEKVFQSNLSAYFKQGDRLLIINRTMISDELQEEDIFKLLVYTSVPLILWVTWDADTFLNSQDALQEVENQGAYVAAKAYLLKTNHHEEISLYDHLALLIAYAIKNSQNNMNDLLNSFYQNIHYPILKSDLRPAKKNSNLNMMKIHAQLLEGKDRDLLKPKDFMMTSAPYLMEMANYCSNAGYGIHPNEMLLIWSAMKRLNNRINCTEMKFWGKIFGLHCDYYIVQIEHEKEIPYDEIDILSPFIDQKRSKQSSEPHISQQEHLNIIPSEPEHVGTNRYTYFVTNSPGLPWIKLSNIKPIVLIQARKIRSLFTGCLSAEVNGFSPSYGFEKDYLRAQIARITATTHISPAGFYILAENEGEEETTINTERKDAGIIRNAEFNNDSANLISAETLSDSNLQEWVHSEREILPQGRTQYWHLSSPISTNVTSDDENEDETTEENDRQIPAPLLQPIGDDQLLDTKQNSWSIGLTMSVMREYSLCYVRSNLWPGAFTLGHAKIFYNFYVGWGQKYEKYQPYLPPIPEMEYAQNFFEQNDPSVELENARRAITNDQTTTSDEDDETFEDLDEQTTEDFSP